MKLALAQYAPVPLDVEANLRTSEQRVADAAQLGARLVVFPELWLTGYELERIATTPACWLGPEDPRLDGMRRVCREHAVTAILGGPWRAAGDAADGKPRLAAIIVHADGRLEPSSKQHLHGREHDVFSAAPPAPAFDVAGWRVSIAICFDMSKPAHAMAAAAQHTDLYIGSALYTRGEERRCDLHFGARAMDHRMFSALANYAGATGAGASCGGSGVWRPNGETLCRAGDGETEALLMAELDHSELEAYRHG